MTASVNPLPTRRSIRRTIASALSIDPSFVFSACRALPPGFPVDPPARLAASMLVATMAAAPSEPGRRVIPETNTRDEFLAARMQRIAGLRPMLNATRITRGSLPTCLRIFAQPDLPLVTAIEIMLEQTHTPDVLQYFASPAAAGGLIVPHDCITIDLHTAGTHPRVALKMHTVSGVSYSTTFGESDDINAPPPSALAMRVYPDIRAIVEIGRMLAGDTAAEERVAEHAARPHAAMPVHLPPAPARPTLAPQRVAPTGTPGLTWAAAPPGIEPPEFVRAHQPPVLPPRAPVFRRVYGESDEDFAARRLRSQARQS